MKFFYENLNFKNKSNGRDFCHISNLDWNYGFENPIFELNNEEHIIWNLSVIGEMSSNVVEQNRNYIESAFEKIKDKPNVNLVFSNFHEGTNQNVFFSKLILLKDKYDIADDQIVVVTNNRYSELFNKRGIKVIHKPYLFGFLVDHYRDLQNQSIEHKGTEIGLLKSFEYIRTPKKKFFLSYNKNTTKTFRIQLILWLIKNGMIDDSYVSVLIKNNNFNLNELISNDVELSDLAQYYEKFDSMGFNVLDWDYPNHRNDVFSNLKYTTKSHYADTYFNIISETSFENNSLNLTEKSFKALANCHPFLIIGDMNSNQYLRDLGFMEYSDLIDYTFDYDPDNHRRLSNALVEVRKIYNLGGEKLIKWYRNNISKIERNREHFFTYSFSKMIDETIQDLKNLNLNKL